MRAAAAGSWSRWSARAARPWASTAWPTTRSTRGTRARPRASCRGACCRAREVWALRRCSRPRRWWLAAAMLNPLCLALSPVALAIVFGYSYTKRFTSLSHLVLGAGPGDRAGRRLARRPRTLRRDAARARRRRAVLGGRLRHHLLLPGRGVRPRVGPALAARAPRRRAARSLLARGFHVAAVGPARGRVLAGAAAPALPRRASRAIAGLLAYEHSLVRADDLSRVNAAFFTVNGWISVGLPRRRRARRPVARVTARL